MYRTNTWKSIALTALTVAAMAAQDGPKQDAPKQDAPKPASTGDPSDSGVLIRSTTRLIQLNVVVHDRKGEPVKDLKKEDFKIFDNGKPQKVAVFSMDANVVLPQMKPLPQNVFTNKLTVRGGVPNSVSVNMDIFN